MTKSKPPTLPAPTAAERDTALAARIDAGLPVKGVMDELSEAGPVEREAAVEAAVYPFVTDAWLRSAMTQLMNTYGMAFAVAWRGDPDRLLSEALNLLASLRLVARVEGGVLALPLLARYRGTTAEVRPRARRAQSQTDTLFDVEEAQ